MRILLLNDGATPVGGAELQALRMRELLRRRGHEVRLLASRASDIGGVPEADSTCFGSTHPKLRVLNQTANLSAARAVRRELETFRPDVVHVRMFLTQLSPLVLPALRGVPLVWQVVYLKAICPRGTKVLPDGRRCTVRSGAVCLQNRCVTPQSWALDMAQQRLWRHWFDAVDRVVTISETMRRRLEAEGLPVDAVIPNGVPERPARPPLSGRPVVAYAGRLVHEKGVDVLLHAIAAVRADVPDVELLVAGTGPEQSALRALASELELDDCVSFLGHLDRDRLEQTLDRAWVQVVPGRWEEPLGNVALEAAARGTAVVATDLGGPAEVVTPETTGLLVPPDAPQPLAAALRRLLTDPQLCERFGVAARARATDVYGEGRALDRIEEVYASMTGSPTSGRRRATRPPSTPPPPTDSPPPWRPSP